MFLTNEDLERYVVHYSINNLFILPSGPTPPNPSELFASERMKQFIGQLKERYDFIIFDSPPLLPVTDAAVLSKACDATLLVVRSGKTVIEAAHRVKTILDNLKVNILGTVIVDVDQRREHYYYYDYKYKYKYIKQGTKSK
jgi:capsular exopolysaccharide synthesis family protein